MLRALPHTMVSTILLFLKKLPQNKIHPLWAQTFQNQMGLFLTFPMLKIKFSYLVYILQLENIRDP